MNQAGFELDQVHLRAIHPFPKGLGELLENRSAVLVPELNLGQLLGLLRAEFPKVEFVGLNKVKGLPFSTSEIEKAAAELLAQYSEL